jgi:hypothetical protein
MRTENNITEGIARQLKGRAHATGTFVSYESRAGRITMTSQCSQCGGPRSGISVTNAAQAAQNPSIRLINCQHCTFVVPTPAKQTYEDVLRIPERDRTSAQDRIVLEHEFALRNAEKERAKNAPILAARAAVERKQNVVMWDQRESYLMALAHEVGAQFVNDHRVLQHEDFLTFEQWVELSEENRELRNRNVAQYFANHGIRA